MNALKKTGFLLKILLLLTAAGLLSFGGTAEAAPYSGLGDLENGRIGVTTGSVQALQGAFSRRINEKDRLVYYIEGGRIYIAHCRGHYGDR